MTYFIKRGSRYAISDEADLQIEKRLPAGTYTIGQDQYGNFYFEVVDSFTHHGKVYGDALQRVDRILRTFEDRQSGTGVLLGGEKGSGKTLLAKLLSIEGIRRDYVTLLINQPWAGESFNAFIQSIDQPTIMIFDEFEKVYAEKAQEAILTLLDGTYSSKKLFVMTCNEMYRVSRFMQNRPGRFYYMLQYGGVDEQFIRDYCDDNLKDLDQVDRIINYASSFHAFSFDILKAMVEEMNRYDEGVQAVLEYLNVNSDDHQFVYVIKKFIPNIPENLNKQVKSVHHENLVNGGTPMNAMNQIKVQWQAYSKTPEMSTRVDETYNDFTDEFDMSVVATPVGESDDMVTSGFAFFTFNDIVKYEKSAIVYSNDTGYLEIEKKAPEKNNFAALL